MKTKILSTLILIAVVICTAIAFAAEPAAVPAAVPAIGEPSILAWFVVNKAAVLGAALALSELLSLIPAFKGNGIMDTVLKALQTLSAKDQA
jgi:hypothetical protein